MVTIRDRDPKSEDEEYTVISMEENEKKEKNPGYLRGMNYGMNYVSNAVKKHFKEEEPILIAVMG